MINKIALGGLPLTHLASGGAAVKPRRVHCVCLPFPAAYFALYVPLPLCGIVQAHFLAVNGDGAVIQLPQLFRAVRRIRQPLNDREKRVAAIPAAQPRPGAVTRGGVKIRVFVRLPGTGKPFALPRGVGRPRAVVGGGLHEVCFHLVHTAQLHLCGGLVHPRQGRPAKSHIQIIHPAGGVLDHGQAVSCQRLDACFYGILIAECPGGYLLIRKIKGVLKLLCSGCRRGTGQIAVLVQRFGQSRLYDLLHIGVFCQRQGIIPGSAVQLIIHGEGAGCRLIKQEDQLFLRQAQRPV